MIVPDVNLLVYAYVSECLTTMQPAVGGKERSMARRQLGCLGLSSAVLRG